MKKLLALVGLLALLVAGPVYAATATLTWTDASTNEDGFKIQRGSRVGAAFTVTGGVCSPAPAFAPLAQVGAGVQTYVDTPLVEGTAYAYAVDAFNVAGESAWSNCAAIAFPFTAVSTPTGLAVTQAGVATWVDKSSTESGFKLQRKPGTCTGSGVYADVTTTASNVVTFADPIGVQGQTYCYRVAALNGLGDSPWSATAERSVPFQVPAPPTGLGVVATP